jgi:hypothetical protein
LLIADGEDDDDDGVATSDAILPLVKCDLGAHLVLLALVMDEVTSNCDK